MSNGSVDNLIRAASGELAYYIEKKFDACEGTPIERIFETAIYTIHGMAQLAGIGCKLVKAPAGSPLSALPDTKPEIRISDVWYWTQHRILDWKVDFVIGTVGRDCVRRFIVVECDGHEFHERTKEQAEKDRSRDRRLQDAGYKIYRFTGRELYRDAHECATQVLLALTDMTPVWRSETGQP